MDDLKNFEKSERDVNGLNTTVQVLINETGMRFRIKKGGVLLLKGGKAVSSEAVEMSDSERIKQVEEKQIYVWVFQNTTKSRKAR